MSIPTVTKNLIIINVLVFFATLVAERYGVDLANYLGLHIFLSKDFNAAQFFTYMFMHGGFTHLFFNMFAVFMFAPIIEQAWGPRRFLFYYIFCGIGAGLVNILVTYLRLPAYEAGMTPDMISTVVNEGADLLHKNLNYTNSLMGNLNLLINMPTVGASGSIFAILLAFGMLYPNGRMFVFPLPFPIKAKWFVAGYAIIELLFGVANRTGDNVAHFAHLGGMLFGLLLILYWRKTSRSNGTYYH